MLTKGFLSVGSNIGCILIENIGSTETLEAVAIAQSLSYMCEFKNMLLFVSKQTDLLQVFKMKSDTFWIAFRRAEELDLLTVVKQTIGYAIYINPDFFCAGGREGKFYQRLLENYIKAKKNLTQHPLVGRRYINPLRVHDYITQQKLADKIFKEENESNEDVEEDCCF
jgi:hypothetical protein